jgi:hypothetical protein
VQTVLTVLTQKPAFPLIISLAAAENATNRWKPFSSLAAPASSAATPAKRSPRTASYRSHLTHADFVRWGPLVKGYILEVAALNAAFERHRPGAVLHFAALAYVGEPMSRPLPITGSKSRASSTFSRRCCARHPHHHVLEFVRNACSLG